MAKKSATQTKTLKDSCVGEIKDFEGGGFTCKNKDGKWITCLPSEGSTSSCWIGKREPDFNTLRPLVAAQSAIETAIRATVDPEPDQDDYKSVNP